LDVSLFHVVTDSPDRFVNHMEFWIPRARSAVGFILLRQPRRAEVRFSVAYESRLWFLQESLRQAMVRLHARLCHEHVGTSQLQSDLQQKLLKLHADLLVVQTGTELNK
jgi:hypothetical protein